MAFISVAEIIDMIIMTVVVGFIFMDMFRMPGNDDPVKAYMQQKSFQNRLLYTSALVAPAIILHELGHKFVALSFGLAATFKAAYTWLGIGVILKLVNFPLLVIVPAYVSVIGAATPMQHALIAFAGPGINLVLFLVSVFVLRTRKLEPKWILFWKYTRIINLFLFVFNLLPIPGFDGSKVFSGLLQSF